MRPIIIKLFTFVAGLYFFLEFILPDTFEMPLAGNFKFGLFHDQISTGVITVGYMALGLGLFNLINRHGRHLLFLKKGWPESLSLLAGLGLMLIVSGADWLQSERNTAYVQSLKSFAEFSNIIVEQAQNGQVSPQLSLERVKLLRTQVSAHLRRGEEPENIADIKVSLAEPELVLMLDVWMAEASPVEGATIDWGVLSAFAVALNTAVQEISEERAKLAMQTFWAKAYNFLYEGLFVALGSAMFSLLAFYIASAAFRAFRINSLEGGLMMAAAFAVILGQIPFAVFGRSDTGLWLVDLFPKIRIWLLSVPSTAAFRAIELGAAVASLVLAFRMWFSIESNSFTRE